MELVKSIAPLRARLRRANVGRIGLVPTMGNLHQGHIALARACRTAADTCVVSVFVNPTQFGPGEDFQSYPRTLAADLRLLEDAGVDVVFAPPDFEMYPGGRRDHTTIAVPALARVLCGASRPGHFDGVATVVAKLFNIVAPRQAFFGEKDWQQLAIVRAMARQLNMPVDVVGVPTVRAPSGLALSSRNSYLTGEQRKRAALLNRTLRAAAQAIRRGERDHRRIERDAWDALSSGGFNVDYVAVRDAARLVEPDADTLHVRILAAARLGRARLIDNVGWECESHTFAPCPRAGVVSPAPSRNTEPDSDRDSKS